MIFFKILCKKNKWMTRGSLCVVGEAERSILIYDKLAHNHHLPLFGLISFTILLFEKLPNFFLRSAFTILHFAIFMF